MTSRTPQVQGLPHGQNEPLQEAAQAVTRATQGETRGGSRPGAGGGQGQAPQPVQRPNVFGATNRPGEPITAGAGGGSGILPQDGASLLRALYVRFPNEDLRRLLERYAEETRRS